MNAVVTSLHTSTRLDSPPADNRDAWFIIHDHWTCLSHILIGRQETLRCFVRVYSKALLLKLWNQDFLTAFGTTPTMFCVSYFLLKRTFTIICDNDLIPLPFLQKTTIWSGRIFFIGCYLGILITSCLYCVNAFHFTISMYTLRTFHLMFHCICMYVDVWLSDLNKETTYLLTYSHKYDAWPVVKVHEP